MVDDNGGKVWRVEEEFATSGERRVFVRAPEAATLGQDIQIQVIRLAEPPFLTDEGWADKAQNLQPRSVEIDGGDLLIELTADHMDEIGDYEAIEISVVDSEIKGSMPWVMEPVSRSPKPRVRLLVKEADIQPGETVHITWDSEYVEALYASGHWDGERELSGEEDITLKDPGEYEFTLADRVTNGQAKASVFVSVPDARAKTLSEEVKKSKLPLWWVIAGGVVLLLAIVLFLLFKPNNDPAPPSSDKCIGSGESRDNSALAKECDEGTQPSAPSQLPSTEGDDEGEVDEEDEDEESLSKYDKSPNTSDIEELKRLISSGIFEDDSKSGERGARTLLTELLGQGNTEAASIAAAAIQGPEFSSGVFDERSDRRALQYYRLACTGGANANEALVEWRAKLEIDYASHPKEDVRDIITTHIPALLEDCKN